MFYWIILFSIFFFFVRDLIIITVVFCALLVMIFLSRSKLAKSERFSLELVKIILAFFLSIFLFCHYSPKELINTTASDELSGFCVDVDKSGFDLYADYEGKYLKFRVIKKHVNPHFENRWVTVSGFSDKELLPANRGGFDYDSYLKAHLYNGYLYPKIMEIENPGEPASEIPYYLKIKLALIGFRSDLRKRMDFLEDDSKILVRALLFGEIERSWLSDFSKKLGVIHIFVISGMHFNLIAGGFKKMCLFLSRGRFHLSQVLYLTFSFFFLFLNDFSIGATRAFLMILLQVLCFYTKRVYDSRRFLILIAGIWGLLNPNVLMQPSFHLSFVASYFVIEISNYKQIKTIKSEFLKGFLISTLVSALMFSIIYVHYLEIHLISIFLIPFITVMVVVFILLSIFYLGLDFLFDMKLGISILDQIRVLCMDAMDAMAGLLKNFMSLNAMIPQYPIEFLYALSVFLSVFFVCFFILKSFRRDLLARGELFLFSVVVAVIFASSYLDYGFSVRTFALRDGESYLIRWNQTNVVYDVGNDAEIIHCLKRCGVRTIDLLVISHFDQDHCGMLEKVLRSFNVKYAIYPPQSKLHVINPGCEEPPNILEISANETDIKTQKSLQYKEMASFQSDKKASNRKEFEEDKKYEFNLNHAHIQYSSLIFSEKNRAKNLNKNESSIIMSIEYENKIILLNGDIEKEGIAFQNRVFAQEIKRADIIKMPHHGSYREELRGLFALAEPKYYVIGGGRGKKIKKHRTLEALKKIHLPYYDTNYSGEIFINYHFGRWKTVEYKNEL